MKATAPFVPILLPEPCPKCGGQVFLRQREKRFYARCAGADCRFGFDANRSGRATGECPACGTGRLRSTPKGKVCADCGRWDNSAGRPGQSLCPKCKSGRLSVIKGEYGYFTGCSDLVCGLTFTCDEQGRPEGGRCRVCKGPVRKTRSGARICVVCEAWQEPKPVLAPSPKPAEGFCPACGKTLRTVWTRRKRWVYRCDDCQRWLEAP